MKLVFTVTSFYIYVVSEVIHNFYLFSLLNNYDKRSERWGVLSVFTTSPASIRDLFVILNAYDFGLKLMAFHKSDTQSDEGGRNRKKNNCNESDSAKAEKLNMCI